MEPKTKLQKEVYALSKKLPPIRPKMKKWAHGTALGLYGMISRNRMFCLECGYKWKPEPKEIVHLPQVNKSALLLDILDETNHPQKNGPDWIGKCPSCKNKIKIHRKSESYLREDSWWGTWTTFHGFQVLRMSIVGKYMAKQKKAYWHSSEEIQYWISPEGKLTVVSRVAPTGWFAVNFSGDLVIRETGTEKRAEYNVDPKHLYEQPVISEITRNGYDGKFYGIEPHNLFSFILSSQKGETLLKMKQYGLLKYFAQNPKKMTEPIWTALKICFRNKYIINEKNVLTWLDYIALLVYFEKDLHNAVYVCPKNLNKSHDKYVKKKQEIDRKIRAQEIRQNAIKDQADYEKAKSRFFHLLFANEDLGIIIEPMKTVDQVFEESDRLHHCAFTNSYYNKKDSLLLSARCGGKVMETMEVNLERFAIVQSRGLQNRPSKFNKEFINLVNSNMNLIRLADKAKRNQKKVVSETAQSCSVAA